MIYPEFSLHKKRIWIAGHRGMVGSALVRRLQREECHVLTVERQDLDLREQAHVRAFLQQKTPEVVFLAAAKVGGIFANNSLPANFLYDNLVIEANIIHESFAAKVQKLVFLGSSCIYPKMSPQPIKENALLTGPLEPTNQWYAIAKIAGIKLCQAYREQYNVDFVSAMPTNLYGPGDNYDLNSSHVLPALIRKAHEAKLAGSETMTIWGSGTPLREFLHVDDCADALVLIAKTYSEMIHINVGAGTEISIADLAHLVADIVGFKGVIAHDNSKPDGTPRKLMDSSRLRHLGWEPKIGLREGISSVYAQFCATERTRTFGQ